jgi:hypothetical protein
MTHNGRHDRIRHTASGALAALIVVGAIAGTGALAASPQAKTGGSATTPAPCAAPDKRSAAHGPDNPQPFLNAIHQLVTAGTLTAAQGQVVDREVQMGRVNTDILAASGINGAALHAVQQALQSTKRALAPAGSTAAK